MTDAPDSERAAGAPQAPRGNSRYLSEWHASRTANTSAGFFRSYLKTGMTLLDCGCGTGSITLGLAEAIAPGDAVGVDMDPKRIERATADAESQGVANVRYEVADICSLPFPDEHFDAAFEHQVFIHISDPVAAAREVYRILKPGGLFAARDADHDSLLRGGASPLVSQAYEAWHQWQKHRGSNHFFGKHLRSTLRQVGFEDIVATFSVDPSAGSSCGDRWEGAFAEPEFFRVVQELGLADAATFERWRHSMQEWVADPDFFNIGLDCEVVGLKRS